MSDWPLSPLPSQRKQQLEDRKHQKALEEAERVRKATTEPFAPFSPAKFIRSAGEETTTEGGLTSRNTTPRVGGNFSIKYEMGFSNASTTSKTDNAFAGTPTRPSAPSNNGGSMVRRGSDSVAASARKEPAGSLSTSNLITNNVTANKLGSPFNVHKGGAKDRAAINLGRVGESMATKFDNYSSTLNLSKHSQSNRGNNKSHDWVNDTSLRSTTPKRVAATTARIQKSAVDVNDKLHKHLNDLIGLKYRCETALDAMAKEFSVLAKESTEAEKVIATLRDRYQQHQGLLEQWRKLPPLATESPSRRHQEVRLAEIASRDPHRAAFKPHHSAATRPDMDASRPASHANKTQIHQRPDTTAFVGLSNTDKALHYGPVLLKEIAFLKQSVDKCRQLLSDTGNVSDKLHHLAMLIDVATNVDLVCLGQKSDDGQTISVPASPAFPKLSLSDFDATENEAALLTSHCTRAAADLRKSIQTAIAGHSQCFEAVIAAMRLGIKCADARQAECNRQIEEIDRDTLLRVQRHLDECLQEEAHCEERIKQVRRIIDIRAAALAHNVFGDCGGFDAVSQSALEEQRRIMQRMDEIQAKKEILLHEYDNLQNERNALMAAAAEAVISQELCEHIEQYI